MAFANDVMQQSLNQVNNAPGPMDTVKTGMQLVQLRDQIQAQKADIEAKKQAVEIAKTEKAIDLQTKLARMPKEKRALALKQGGWARKTFEQLGASSEDLFDTLINDDTYNENVKKLAQYDLTKLATDPNARADYLQMLMATDGGLQMGQAVDKMWNQINDQLKNQAAERHATAQEKLAAEAAKRAEATAERNAANQQYDNISQLRKERESNPTTKDTRIIQGGYEGIQAAANGKTMKDKKGRPSSDIALVYSFMKVLDPGSTVREGEYATAEKAQGVPGWIRLQYDKLLDGDRLTPEMRQDFVNTAKNKLMAQLGMQEKADSQILHIAKANGFPTDQLGIRENDKLAYYQPKQAPQLQLVQKLKDAGMTVEAIEQMLGHPILPEEKALFNK